MKNHDWSDEFRRLWDRGIAAWKAGRRAPASMFRMADVTFLVSIGCSPQEMFDFVDDHEVFGEPEFDDVLKVTAVRRDFFLNVQEGRSTGRMAEMESLPAKDQEAEGMVWLPRIIAKARLKLRGEMPPDLMYGCGGDRSFFSRVNLSAAEFLELVRDNDGDDRTIIQSVKKRAGTV